MEASGFTLFSPIFLCTNRSAKRFVSCSTLPSLMHFSSTSLYLSLSLSRPQQPYSNVVYTTSVTGLPRKPLRFLRVLAVAEEENLSETMAMEEEEENCEGAETDSSSKLRAKLRPCELYVCNLPRSFDISELLDTFKHHGTVQSVEISRNPETGMSRGCGYVTMGSIGEAKAAITALDGSDVGGREMRVRFSADMNLTRKNVDALNSSPRGNIVFESPYKIYVGNLSWYVKPEYLREYFSQFGNVVSTRLLYDRKAGKKRVFAFLSFSSDEERAAAISSNGKEFLGRTLLVREAFNSSDV